MRAVVRSMDVVRVRDALHDAPDVIAPVPCIRGELLLQPEEHVVYHGVVQLGGPSLCGAAVVRYRRACSPAVREIESLGYHVL